MANFVVVQCDGPKTGTNTNEIPQKIANGLSYLESYTYSCKEGYTTTDDLCTVCQPNGNLSLPKPPNCTGE